MRRGRWVRFTTRPSAEGFTFLLSITSSFYLLLFSNCGRRRWKGNFLFSPAPFPIFLGGRPHCTPLFFRGGFMIPFMFSLIFDFSLRRGGGLFSILFTPIKFLIYLFDALRPRRAPTFWPAESRQRLAKEGCAPFGIPPAVALECPSGTTARGDGGTPRRFAAGASAPDLRGRCRNAFETRCLHLCRACAILKMMRDQPTTKVAASEYGFRPNGHAYPVWPRVGFFLSLLIRINRIEKREE